MNGGRKYRNGNEDGSDEKSAPCCGGAIDTALVVVVVLPSLCADCAERTVVTFSALSAVPSPEAGGVSQAGTA
jgi:hypothetical protein